jgi:hypothetical protein
LAGKKIENVFKVLNGVHRSKVLACRLFSGGRYEIDLTMDGDQGRQPFLGSAALPEIKIPRFSVGERSRPMGVHALPTRATSLFKTCNCNILPVISAFEQVLAGREISRLLLCCSLDHPFLGFLFTTPTECQMLVDPVDELVIANSDHGDPRSDHTPLHLEHRQEIDLAHLVLGVDQLGRVPIEIDSLVAEIERGFEPGTGLHGTGCGGIDLSGGELRA